MIVEVAPQLRSVAGQSAKDLEISIFPNPVKNNLNIALSNVISTKYNVNILTVTGKKVMSLSAQLNNNNIIVNANTLTRGTYLLELVEENGTKWMSKFIKE